MINLHRHDPEHAIDFSRTLRGRATNETLKTITTQQKKKKVSALLYFRSLSVILASAIVSFLPVRPKERRSDHFLVTKEDLTSSFSWFNDTLTNTNFFSLLKLVARRRSAGLWLRLGVPSVIRRQCPGPSRTGSFRSR